MLNFQAERRSGLGVAEASRAVRAQDGVAATLRRLDSAIRRAPADVSLRLKAARLREASGDRGGAAVELTRLLRFDPQHLHAARRLGTVLAGGVLPDTIALDPAGLAAALSHLTVDRDLIGAAALRQLRSRGPLASALARCREQGAQETARAIVARRSSDLLRDSLLLAVLQNAIVTDLPTSELLAALRRALLVDVSPTRLGDADTARFAAALVEQCRLNEYILPATPEERARIDALAVPSLTGQLDATDAGLRLIQLALYRDPARFLPEDIPSEALPAVRPLEIAGVLMAAIEERREIRAGMDRVEKIGPIVDETSRKVRDQYESHPYPRWRAVATYDGNQYSNYLATFFGESTLTFMQRPFEVLIAGCGTGCQAASAAFDYGSHARILGLDLSAGSLGYASMMAKRLGVSNLSLAQGDIAAIPGFTPSWRGRFHVIECSGVLHHMADPFAAWLTLIDCLAPGGLMLVGLYSAVARRDLDVLRETPGYPGPGCDDDALRAWRSSLISRSAGAPGERYLRARDTFTTSGFRDFFLHVNEKTTTLAEIDAFLDANGLAFRGFVNAPFGEVERRFPGQAWPGRLTDWAALEAERPDLFLGMYQFWVTRR
ncbi:MAG: methyltransferase domain-containing protein [Hyphomicrobiaceae bacterium]|nr:methyltransferase domain-containing protein [Hyphomicrobiaceae bacterium]